MIPGSLPPSQAVFIADTSQEVLQTRHPGANFFCVVGHQVQGLDPPAKVNAKAAVWVEAIVGVPPEHLGLLPLADLMNGVDGDWNKQQSNISSGRCNDNECETLDFSANQKLSSSFNTNNISEQ